MRVAEYRDLIDACNQVRCDFSACVGDYEQRLCIERLRRSVEELKAAKCGRLTERDSSRAQSAISAGEQLVATKKAQFDAADVAFTRMAFAGEWR